MAPLSRGQRAPSLRSPTSRWLCKRSRHAPRPAAASSLVLRPCALRQYIAPSPPWGMGMVGLRVRALAALLAFVALAIAAAPGFAQQSGGRAIRDVDVGKLANGILA